MAHVGKVLREGPFTADIDANSSVEVKQDGYRYNSLILSAREIPQVARLLSRVQAAGKRKGKVKRG